jgi:CHAT domain-containing protein
LAGVNKPSAADDGVLTALEVAEMDLRKTRLVVLSACETGLGQTAGGEGVFGLQRAFQVAGAKSVVVTLWQIDDEASRRLMERFYQNLWGRKMSMVESLREAQQWMLHKGANSLRQDASRGMIRSADPKNGQQLPYTPPYYWAGFVLSGDWR